MYPPKPPKNPFYNPPWKPGGPDIGPKKTPSGLCNFKKNLVQLPNPPPEARDSPPKKKPLFQPQRRYKGFLNFWNLLSIPKAPPYLINPFVDVKQSFGYPPKPPLPSLTNPPKNLWGPFGVFFKKKFGVSNSKNLGAPTPNPFSRTPFILKF